MKNNSSKHISTVRINKFSNHVLSINSLNELSAAQLVNLITNLRSYELSPGGPYFLSLPKSNAIKLNAHIYKLFASQGKTLPLVKKYLQGNQYPLVKTYTSNVSPQKSLTYQNKKSYRLTENWLKSVSLHLKQEIAGTIQKIYTSDDNGEISNLSESFHTFESSQPNANYTALNAANILVWAAYTLYDTAVDTSVYNQKIIPAANMCLRQAYNWYFSYIQSTPKSYNKLIAQKNLNKLFNKVDSAIAEEISLRSLITISNQEITIAKPLLNGSLLPKFRRILSNKSIAHCIVPILLQPNNSAQIEKAFSLYCAARQLNDDIHDWQDDLLNCQPQYAIAVILKNCKNIHPNDSIENINEAARASFWESDLNKLLNKQISLINEATNIFINDCGLSINSPFMKNVVTKLGENAKLAKKSHTFEKTFTKRLRTNSKL